MCLCAGIVVLLNPHIVRTRLLSVVWTHKAIVLLDQPEVGDQHIWNSFRHHISMGDIFPDSWKDLLGDGQTDDQADIEEEQPLHDGGEL